MITFDSIHIQAFGGIESRSIDLTPGLNLLRGDNESGKSTTLAFLHWMLYGYPSSAEKKRLKPLSGQLPAGALGLTVDGVPYRILRKTGASGRDSVQIQRLSDQTVVGNGMEPGQYFLGIDRELFDHTAIIRQGDGGAVDGKRLSQAMNNILASADERISPDKALDELEKSRVALWHLNKKGGKITAVETAVADLRTRLNASLSAGEEIGHLEQSITEKNKTLASHREQAGKFRSLLLAYQVKQRREKEALLAEKHQAYRDAHLAVTSARDAGLPSGFVPSEPFRARLNTLSDHLTKSEAALTLAQSALATALSEQNEDFDPRFARFGGVDQTLSAYLRHEKRAKTLTLWGLILLILLIGIPLLILGANERKKARAILNAFGATSFAQLKAIAADGTARRRSILEQRQRLTAERDRCQSIYDRAREEASALAIEAMGSDFTPDPYAPLASLKAALTRYDQELLALGGNLREAKAAYESVRSLLDHEPMPECDPASLPVLPEDFDPLKTKRNQSIYENQIPMLEQKIQAELVRHAELQAKREDPATLADQLQDAQNQLHALHAEYEATELAISALKQAAAGMRDSITARLATESAKHLATMTAGRYDSLSVDADFDLLTTHPDQNGLSVPLTYLSEGTRNQAYLALRLALSQVLSSADLAPLILDEALVYLDDRRLAQVLKLLASLDRQVILFTASGREERILQSRAADVTG